MGGEWASKDDFASGKVAWGVDGGVNAHKNYWTQGANNYPVPIGEGTSTSYYRAKAECGTGGSVTIKRGDIYYADLSPVVGSEQGGVRPVLIVQNDVGNRYSPTVIAAAITSQHDKANLPTHIQVQGNASGLTRDSIVLLEQIRTIDKKRLKERMGRLDDTSMAEIDTALSISFGLGRGGTT